MSPFPKEYLEYIKLFNEESFFEAHEVLEDLWQIEKGEARPFYQGLIQIAALFTHLKRGTPQGCPKLFTTASKHLEPFRPHFMGLDLEALLRDTQAAMAGEAGLPKMELGG